MQMRRYLFLLLCVFCTCTTSALAQDLLVTGASNLSSEAIATNALWVANTMNRTGRCYEGVSRALQPLGVTLTGNAAYEANELLLKDQRFIPLIITDINQLRRGDIVVYNKSQSHPYGHISVYQGNAKESSDHVAALTHTRDYGGASVFRLASEHFQVQSNKNLSYKDAFPPTISYAQSLPMETRQDSLMNAANYVDSNAVRRLRNNALGQAKRTLLRKAILFLLN